MRIVLALLVMVLAQGLEIDWKGDEKLAQRTKISESLVDSLGLKYYRAKFKFNPSWATSRGFHDHDANLPTFFARRVNRFLNQTKRAHKRLDRVVEDSLGIDKWIDYTALLADMDTQIFLLEELEVWRSWPTLYADGCIEGIYALLVSPDRTNLKENLASRLSEIPEVVSRARENLTTRIPPRLRLQASPTTSTRSPPMPIRSLRLGTTTSRGSSISST